MSLPPAVQPAETDVLIAGGGPAGLIAAAAFAAEGHAVLLVDPEPPVTDAADPRADIRTTAFLGRSRGVLEAAGLWDGLAPHAMPLERMRIVDAGGAESVPRLSCDFDARDVTDGPFGWNLPNWLIRREVLARLATQPRVALRPGLAALGTTPRGERTRVALSDGSAVEARLVVAADGRDSALRAAHGIGARTWRYGQKALAFAVTHERPHENVSIEIHRAGGPFTLVPLPDRDGRPCSAVVWMERGPEALRLAALPPEAFAAALNARGAGVLGRLTPASRVAVWPIIARLADRFAAPRLALIAEAAHVVPPIGAQGLNMSLGDLAALIELSRGGLGEAATLAAYERRRRPAALARILGIDALNRASMAEARPLRDLRAAGLAALHRLGPVRRLAMRAGMNA